MRTALLAFAVAVLSAAPCLAAPLGAADQASLAGEWRANPEKPGGACGLDGGQNGGMGDIRMVIEFAVTGGIIGFDDGTEGSGEYTIASGMADKAHVALALKEGGTLNFARGKDGLLKASESEAISVGIGGMTFKRCRAPADRSAIKLTKAELGEISSGMPPHRYIFIDSRAKLGCKAIDYQYIYFDLVGPLAFEAGRANSFHVGETLAEGKPVKLPRDELSLFAVDKAERGTAPNSYRLTLTEKIPPNWSRGDTTTITLTLAKNGNATIPEWKRTYRRCADSELAAK